MDRNVGRPFCSWTMIRPSGARWATSSKRKGSRAPKVLVVDDDPGVRDALAELLASEGYAVAVAENGRVAVDLLQAGLRPCAVILDLMMPVMDGWDFRATQIQSPELKEVPVVLITAAGFSKESVRTQFGDLPFFAKPPNPDALLATVKRVCGHLDASQ
jgi:CheY-like chemotaxis protein